ncbi:MAG: hypothetical protein MMC33_006693 [Icmadophila ericetorum]|nr:hypothetical protein [Icmadophila ericetorum]
MDFIRQLSSLIRTTPESPLQAPSQLDPKHLPKLEHSSLPQSASPPNSHYPERQQRSIFDPRSRRQLTLFLAGSTFTTLSILLTRRSLVKRRLAIYPTFYHPSNAPPTRQINSGLEAFEALGLATLNVASVTMMMVGGGLWAADISSMEEMRKKVRGAIGVEGQNEEKAEEEFEEWLAMVLERKEKKERRGKKKGKRRRGEVEEEGEEEE